jgi:hypothetical protein
MIRMWNTSVGFVVCALLVAGCTDSTKSAAKKAEQGAKKAAGAAGEVLKEAASEVREVATEAANEAKVLAKEAREAAHAARVAYLKPVEDSLPKMEEKIKALTGEGAAMAKEKFADLKKRVDEARTAAPETWQSLKDGLTKSFDEVKKLAGMEK